MKVKAKAPTPRIAILGAGASGMAVAQQLRAHGIESYTIYERMEGVGGVWRQNTYPGAACDVKSHFYSFSWHRRPDWSEHYAPQPEILEYFEDAATHNGLGDRLVTGVTVTALRWQDDRSVWTIETAGGRTFEADVVVSALGLFNEPKLPDVPGRDTFEGTVFHSAEWNHEHDLTGERVAVVGTGPSAIQFVPEIAPDVAHLSVFQRQPGWVLPKPEARYTAADKDRFRRNRLAAWWHRAKIWWEMERSIQIYPGTKIHIAREQMARRFLEESVEDPEMRAALLPTYPIGCKRMLPSNEWFPTLQRPNVDLVTSPLARIGPSSITTVDGVTREVDTIIYATGFTSARYLSAVEVTGRAGRDLQGVWEAGVRALLGMTVDGFPNLFLMYGPNTNGTTSVIHIAEAQARYIRMMVQWMSRRRIAEVDTKPRALRRWDDRVQARLEGSVWMGGCGSYFLDEQGKVRTQLPYKSYRYWIMTAVPRLEKYRWTGRAAWPSAEANVATEGTNVGAVG